MLVTSRVVLMLQDGHTGASGFSDVKRRAIPPEHLDGRPFRKHRERRKRVRAEFLCRVDNLSAYDREYGFDAFNVLFGDGKVIIGKHSEVSELAWGKGAFFAGLTREPTAALRVKPQGFFATEAIPVGIHRDAADCLSSDQPNRGKPKGYSWRLEWRLFRLRLSGLAAPESDEGGLVAPKPGEGGLLVFPPGCSPLRSSMPVRIGVRLWS